MKKILPIFLFFLMSCNLLFAQVTNITGTIKDDKGRTLPGITVSERGTKNQASSGGDGNFTIKVKGIPTALIISGVGYKKQEIPVNKETHVTINLEESTNDLSEAIVTGYTTISRRKTTGSISSITSKEIENLPAASIDVLLQGKLPGVNVQNFTGQPGVKTSLVIRGNTNIPRSSGDFDADNLSSNPLYVLDGIPVSDDEIKNFNVTGTNYLASLNPNDIESVDVLKDASAAALYGARANNGVIIIKTKRGVLGKPKLSLNTYQGYVTKPGKVETLIGAAERRKKMELIYKYANDAQEQNIPQLLTDSLNPAFNNNNDYQDLFYQSGYVQNYDLAVSGATENVNYRISGGMYNEKGIVKSTGYKRYSFTSNVNFNITQNLEFLTNFKASTGKRLEGKGTTDFLKQGRYRSVFGINPISMPTSLLGMSDDDVNSIINPYDYQRNDNVNVDLSGVGELRYTFLKDFRISTRSIINYSTAKNDFASPSIINTDGLAYAKSTYTQYRKYLLTNNILWTKTLNDKHNITATFVQEYETRKNEGLYLLGRDIPNDNIQVIKGIASQNLSGYSDQSTYAKLSFLGAAHYDYKGKYLFDAVYRGDASSRFGKNNKWGYFPSLGAGWILTEEDFLSQSEWVKELKLRGSWGRTGDESSIGDNDRYNAYIAGNGNYPGNYGSTYGGGTAVIPNYAGITNDDITWQRTETWNAGVDALLFNGRLTVNVDAYVRTTTGQMLSVWIPEYTGYLSTFTNAAGVRNSGLEINLMGKVFGREKALQWTPSINFSFNKNIVTALPDGNRDLYYDQAVYVVGKPLNMFYGYLVNGAISTSNDIIVNPYTGAVGASKWGTLQPGYPNWVDVNGDYKISDAIGENDMTFFGDPNPKVTGGFTNYFSYKDFSLQILTTFTFGRDIINSTFAQRMSNGFFYGNPKDLSKASIGNLDNYDFWQKEGDISRYPAANPYMGLYAWRAGQSMFMEPGWYIRIKNINLAYRFDKTKHAWMNRAGINSFRIYGTMDNVHMFQKFSGIDAERVDGRGFDYGDGYPLPSKYTLGVQFEF
ncbi:MULTISPECIES: SusC/RagA family TonB-linked outer membrane protein [unclassified Sphingobacterium]|uniref:SusC/RagA family TonB-linked outer membrane protein n=2 Tax=Sphingobacterium TaxID=28453 RepID=UPI00143A349B|nr:SusC/RagA family TonB-linked outer membrane protein [Sphingobacterium sp. B16(2022)]NJI74782.1 SusC/RagA family TonB-linked outer membrane protein [Sphingobacterium sp. B16(2022)]